MNEPMPPSVPIDWLGQPIHKGSEVVFIGEDDRGQPVFMRGEVLRVATNRIHVSADDAMHVFGLTGPDHQFDVIVVKATSFVASHV